MFEPEFEGILARAVEEGAKRALADVGLEGKEAALDIRDLRSLVECIRLVRRTAVQATVRIITTGVMPALPISPQAQDHRRQSVGRTSRAVRPTAPAL